ncbi:MAG: signal peptidase I [Acidobacteriaceae bacterium]
MNGLGKGGEVAVQRHSLLQSFQSQIILVVLALFILTFIVQPFRIPSASMEPTLLVGDFLLVDKEISTQHFPAVAPTNFIHRGDLIVFHYPVNPSRDLVKRVIGLPGDHIHLRDGRVFIDGRAFDEPYAVYRAAAPDSYRDDFPRMDRADPAVDSRWWIQMHSLVSQGELTIPADSYFVLGDNRNDSEDSRYWGLVPRAAIVGKPFLIYFSMNLPDGESAPGQSPAANLQPNEMDRQQQGDRRQGAAASLLNFARWERTLRIVR